MMLNELAAIVGTEWVREDEATAAYAVDEVRPQVVVWPGTGEELTEVLRRAHEAGWVVVPAGYGTGLALGNPPERLDLVIVTTRLSRILDYEPADLTASVEAGCSLERFNQTVGQHGQWLPLDPPRPEQATLGAVAAVEDFGPLRLGFGFARDYVIGLHIVQADGSRVKTGGRVVKNVAGYDLNKLFVGSLGTLGIITQLNLKLRPRPETEATCALSSAEVTTLDECARAVMASEIFPAALELLSPRTAQRLMIPCPAHHVVLLLKFMGSDPAVRYQVQYLKDLARRRNLDVGEWSQTRAELLWRSIRDFSVDSTANLMIRVNVFPSEAASAFKRLERELFELIEDIYLLAHHGNGIIRAQARFDVTDARCEPLAERLRLLRTQYQQRGGHLIIERAPVELKKRIDVWGDVGPTADIMRALKQQFDPRRILNPGRFVAGI